MDQNKHQLLGMRDRRWLKLLLSPSWVSLLVAVCCAFAVLTGVLFAAGYQGTSYQQEVSDIRAKQVNAHYSSEDTEFEGLEGNTFTDIVPLLMMWGIIGVIVYFLAASIVQLLQHAAEFKSELGYVNASRNEMLRTAFVHLGIHMVIGALWIVFIFLFFGQIVPYAVDCALAASADWVSFGSILYGLLCMLAISFSMHLHTIFFRLLLLKPRIFSKALYLS